MRTLLAALAIIVTLSLTGCSTTQNLSALLDEAQDIIDKIEAATNAIPSSVTE